MFRHIGYDKHTEVFMVLILLQKTESVGSIKVITRLTFLYKKSIIVSYKSLERYIIQHNAIQYTFLLSTPHGGFSETIEIIKRLKNSQKLSINNYKKAIYMYYIHSVMSKRNKNQTGLKIFKAKKNLNHNTLCN